VPIGEIVTLVTAADLEGGPLNSAPSSARRDVSGTRLVPLRHIVLVASSTAAITAHAAILKTERDNAGQLA